MKKTNKIGKEIKGISVKDVIVMPDIKKTSKLAGSVQGNLYDNNMSTHRNQAKKLRKSNFWNNVRETLHTIASVLVIFFFILWVASVIQAYGQRPIGCDDRGNCYLTKA